MKKTILAILILIPVLSFASIDRDLKVGMTHPQVRELQEILISKGYSTLNTGYFGAKTLQAVKQYQRDNEIPSTGFVGKLTRASLNTISATIPDAIDNQSSTSTPEVVSNSSTTPETVVTSAPKEYNILMDTPETTYITFGTPNSEEQGDLINGYVPVALDADFIKNGGSIIVDGTVPYEVGEGFYGIGREFSKRSGKDLRIPFMQVRGTYSYTITANDKDGNKVFEAAGTLNVPKFQGE